MLRLAEKTALVTGGALGIGRSACLLMAKEGANIAISDVLEEPGRRAVEEIVDAGGRAFFQRLDVTKEQEVKEAVEAVVDQYGRIDVLVNNAGVAGPNKPTHEVTEQEWDDLMAVNVKGVFFCTKHVVPRMKTGGGGSIINLSSIYGIIGAADFPPYHASKGAVRLMTKNDALIYAKDKIRVNSVHPGFIWTPLVEKVGEQSGVGKEEFVRMLEARHPLGRVGEPDDIGWGIVYLASDESKFMTGAELVIDGGYIAQ